jgi:hypothetical protein
VKTSVASGNWLLTTANAMRLGTTPASAFELWLLADRAAAERKRGDRRSMRLVLFQHAQIHAGMIKTRRGTVYRRCSMCREKLS